MNSFLFAFITGLTTGGISCFSVQGSFLTATLANETELNTSKNIRMKAIIVFLISKLIIYTLLGIFLGIIGRNLIVTPKFQGWLQIGIGVFMLLTAVNLANLHPFFKKFVITPPKFIFKIIRNQTKVKSFFTPVLLGVLTVFIPCGVTQAMMLLAVSAGNPLISGEILFAFVLGTSPMFFAIGMAANEIFKRKALLYLAATVVAVLGIISINNGQILRGSVHTFNNYYKVALGNKQISKVGDVVNIEVTNKGYKTDVNTLKLGVPVKLILTTSNVTNCTRAFTIPDLNYFKILPTTGVETVEFTPKKLGNMTFTCSMGMYSGSFNIVP